MFILVSFLTELIAVHSGIAFTITKGVVGDSIFWNTFTFTHFDALKAMPMVWEQHVFHLILSAVTYTILIYDSQQWIWAQVSLNGS